MGDADFYRAQAEKCRALAGELEDESFVANLLAMAKDFDEEAARLESQSAPQVRLSGRH